MTTIIVVVTILVVVPPLLVWIWSSPRWDDDPNEVLDKPKKDDTIFP